MAVSNVWAWKTHPSDVSRPELDGAEQAEDDHDDVEEVGQDGSPLVAQEVYHLTLQHTDLRGGGRREEEEERRLGVRNSKSTTACHVLYKTLDSCGLPRQENHQQVQIQRWTL